MRPVIFCNAHRHSIRCDMNALVLRLILWILWKCGAYEADDSERVEACLLRLKGK